MAITNNSIYPQIKYEGVDIAPGYETNIGIERYFYYKMPSPYSNCRDNVETTSSADSLFYTLTAQLSQYTRNLCYEVCFQYKYVIPACNCSDPSVDSNVNNVTVCTPSNGGPCVVALRKTFLTASCDAHCPETCERVKYSTKVSMSNYPTQ